jgi:hypothetical protein
MKKTLLILGFSLLSLGPFQAGKAQNMSICPRPLRGHFVVRVPGLESYNFVRSLLGDAIACSVIINGQRTNYVQAGNASDRATAQRYLSMIRSRYKNAFIVAG